MKNLKVGSFEINANTWPPSPGKPVLVFIHGASLTKSFWDEQIQGLSEKATPIAVDLPGHGGSSGQPSDTIEAYANAILDFIETADLDQFNIIPAGMSMGGAIVQQLLISSPDRFAGGILINTGARLKVHPLIFDSVSSDFEAFVRSMPSVSLSPKTDPAPFVQRIQTIVGNNDAQTAKTDFTACNTFDVMDKIKDITCPTLVCSASDDVSTPAKYGFWLAENLPNSTHVHVEDAGHFSPLEKHREINRAISDFLDQITL